MNFDRLRPCDACGEGLGLTFFRLQVEHHVVNLNAARQRMALDAMFGSSKLGSAFDPAGDRGTGVAATGEVLLCPACFCTGALAQAWEKRGMEREAQECGT